jgi:arylformamidase
MLIPISYPLTRTSPLYPGTSPVSVHPDKSIDCGNSANTSIISFSCHSGTHIDVPRHFCRNGQSVADFFQSMNSYFPVYCLDIRKNGEQSIQSTDFLNVLAGKNDAQALLIRTGTCSNRKESPRDYATCHPWVQADVADFLRKMCPDLQFLGIDTISISVPSHRIEGHDAHCAFLCNNDHPILLLEDADLSHEYLLEGVYRLLIVPYLIDEIDGVPVAGFLERITDKL